MRTVKEIRDTLKNDKSFAEYFLSISTSDGIQFKDKSNKKCIASKYLPEILSCNGKVIKTYRLDKMKILYDIIFRKYFGDDYNTCVLIDETKGYTLDNIIPVYANILVYSEPCISEEDKLIFGIKKNMVSFFGKDERAGRYYTTLKTTSVVNSVKQKNPHTLVLFTKYKGSFDDLIPVTKDMLEATYENLECKLNGNVKNTFESFSLSDLMKDLALQVKNPVTEVKKPIEEVDISKLFDDTKSKVIEEVSRLKNAKQTLIEEIKSKDEENNILKRKVAENRLNASKIGILQKKVADQRNLIKMNEETIIKILCNILLILKNDNETLEEKVNFLIKELNAVKMMRSISVANGNIEDYINRLIRK